MAIGKSKGVAAGIFSKATAQKDLSVAVDHPQWSLYPKIQAEYSCSAQSFW